MRRCKISSKALIVLTGVVSTAASLVGGLIMYYEGLRVLGKTVEEVGRADTRYFTSGAMRTFTSAENIALETAEMLERMAFPDRNALDSWLRQQLLWSCWYNMDVVETVGLRGWTVDMDPQNQMYELAWWERQRSGRYDWVYGVYRPEHTKEDCGHDFPCVAAYSLDLTKKPYEYVENVYNYSDKSRVAEAIRLREIHGETAQSWTNPKVWVTADGGSFVFWNYFVSIPTLHLPRLFAVGLNITVSIAVVSDPWVAMMETYDTEARVLITLVDNGLDSVVLAGNFDGVYPDQNCSGVQNSDSSEHPCMRYLKHLDSKTIAVVQGVNETAPGEFAVIEGHWVIKHTVYQATPSDTLSDIVLVWFRPQDTIQSDLRRALGIFIGFAVGVFVFDVLIGVCEIVAIASPLSRLADSTRYLVGYRLEDAAEGIRSATDCSVTVSEVAKLQEGLLFAVSSLEEYKAFLPTSLFEKDARGEEMGGEEEEEVEVEEEKEKTEVEGTRHSSSASKQSTLNRSVNLNRKTKCSITVTTCAILVVRLPRKGKVELDEYGAAVEILEGIASNTKGLVHPIHSLACDQLALSWNTSRRCLGYTAQAVSAASAISEAFDEATITIRALQAAFGNVGSATLRGFAVFSRDDAFQEHLGKLAGSLQAELGGVVALLDRNVASSIAGVHFTTLIGALRYGPQVPQRVYSLGKMVVNNVSEEWMYSLQRSEDTTGVSKIIECILSDEPVEMENIQEVAKREVLSPLEKLLLKKLQASVLKEEYVYDTTLPKFFDPR